MLGARDPGVTHPHTNRPDINPQQSSAEKGGAPPGTRTPNPRIKSPQRTVLACVAWCWPVRLMLLCWHWWTGACRLVPSRDDKSAGVRAHREHIGGAAVVVNGSGALSVGCARRWSPRRARRSTRSAAPPVTAAGGEQDETGGDQRAGGDQNPGRVAPGARQLRRRHDRGRADRDVITRAGAQRRAGERDAALGHREDLRLRASGPCRHAPRCSSRIE